MEKTIRKIIATVILTIMLFANFSTVIYAAEDFFQSRAGVNENNEKLQFNIGWEGNETTADVKSGTTVSIPFKIVLSGVQTGFQNLQLIAKTNIGEYKAEVVSWDINKEYVSESMGNVLTFVNTVSSGVELNGTVNMQFESLETFEEYSKDIKFVLEGSYKNPTTGEIDDIQIEKILTANVKPQDYIDGYNCEMWVKSTNVSRGMNDSYTPEYEGEYQVGELSVLSAIHISGNNLSYGTFEINLSRTFDASEVNASNINSEDNLKINCNEVPSEIKTVIERNSDGSTKIKLIVGEEKENYTEEDLVNFDYDFNIGAIYKIIEDNTKQGYARATTVDVNYKGDIKGYTVRKNANGTFYEDRNSTYKDGYSETISLCLYRGDYDATVELVTDKTARHIWENSIDEETTSVKFITKFNYWDSRSEEDKEDLIIRNYAKDINKYANIDGIKFTESTRKVKSIKIGQFPLYIDKITFYKKDGTKFFEATKDNLEYIASEDEVITDYYAVVDKIKSRTADCDGSWTTEYSLNNVSKTAYHIKEYQYATFGNSNATVNDEATHYIVDPPYIAPATEKSYFKISVGEDYSISTTDVGKTVEKKITLSFWDDELKGKNINVRNENPKFFIKLPDGCRYEDFDIKVVENDTVIVSNYNCTDKEEKPFYMDKKTGMLVINCVGTMNSSGSIDISFNRTVISTYSEPIIKAYMITDNEYYYAEESNVIELEKNGKIPDRIGVSSTIYETVTNNNISVNTGVFIAPRTVIYPTASSVIGQNGGEYDNPIKYETNSEVKYRTQIYACKQKISNIKALSRLPIANNKSILGEQHDLNSTLSLINLKDIKVLKRHSSYAQEVIDSNQYKILYSTDYTATYDSQFTEYIEGDTNIANAKTLLIEFNDDFVVDSNEFLYIDYTMEMPNGEGIAGAVTAVQYSHYGSTEKVNLEPSAIYVTHGKTSADIELTKTFEGFNSGTAPTGVSLQGIEFKLINIDTNETLVLDGQTTAEGIITTNEQGKIVLTDVPEGTYEVEEVSEITGWELQYTTVTVEQGNNVQKNIVNKRKYAKLNIVKKWDGAGDSQQGYASFKITRKLSRGDTNSFSKWITINQTTGIGTELVPYGEYSISEQNIKQGWVSDITTSNNTIIVDQEEVTRIVTNRMGKSNLKIVKTLPEGDNGTVEGLTFKIEGTPYITSWIDENGKTKYIDNYEKIVKIGEEQDGVDIEMSADKKTATITLSDLYLGIYIISEIDMPTIKVDDEDIEKYVKFSKIVKLNNDDTTVTEDIKNMWQTGTLLIHKKAEEGVDLTQFKFKVYGTSYYGSSVNETIEIDENGNGNLNLPIGKYTVEEVETDAFIANYEVEENGITVTKTEPQQYEVKKAQTTSVKVHNTIADGYVKIVKTLENETDVSKAKGIQFKLYGIAPNGESISKTITIGDDGTGIFGPIPAGGDYELVEIENTVPEFYEPIEPMKVEISKDNTQEKPLVLNIENPKGRGNLEITTETEPKGGEVYPITYKYQKIILDETTGKYERIDGTERTIDGDVTGFAKIIDLESGNYVVEQESIPVDWIKDLPQIVTVPVNATGYADFIIEQAKETENTKVTIYKQILNPNNNVATKEDFEKYKLNKDESFEVKIVNVDTKDEYYTFIDSENPGVIKDLPSGTYEIMEVYKPKYNTISYNEIVQDMDNKIEKTIEQVEGKYLFTINSEEVDGKEVEIKIINKINENFGFGGQDTKDNLSKVTTDMVEEVSKTRASLYIVDEEGNYLPGCTFDIYDNQGKKIISITPKEKRVIIKGLNAGVYTIKNTIVPNGYNKVEDMKFTVYNGAVRVIRIEIQKNIPRSDLVLETIYKTEDNITKNVPNSKYKIVNSETGELLTFVRKLDGSYLRSNLPTATDTISLKAGEMTIKGIETGTYEVGIVDVTDGYGIITGESVPTVELVENEYKDLDVLVEKKKIRSIEIGYETAYIIDNDGYLWGWGDGPLGDGTSLSKEPICISKQQGTLFTNVKVSKVSSTQDRTAVIDVDGNIWIWGSGDTDSIIPQLIPTESSREVKFVDVAIFSDGVFAIDENGLIWYYGNTDYCGLGDIKVNDSFKKYLATPKFRCFNDIFYNILAYNHPLKDVKIKKVQATIGREIILLDEDGRVWTLGTTTVRGFYPVTEEDRYTATCISENAGGTGNAIYDAYKQGVKIVDISADSKSNSAAALDENGKVYMWHDTGPASLVTSVQDKVIKKIDVANHQVFMIDSEGKVCTNQIEISNDPNLEYMKDVKFIDIAAGYGETPLAIMVDSTNTLWGIGDSYYGLGGIGYDLLDIEDIGQVNPKYPNPRKFDFVVPDYDEVYSYNIKFDKVVTSNLNHSVAIDSEGRLWTWGKEYNNNLGNSAMYASDIIKTPFQIQFNEDVKFKDVAATNYITIALDTKGRVWSWGYDSYKYYTLGVGGPDKIIKTCISELESSPLAEAYKKGITIEKIYVPDWQGGGCVVAIDNLGQVWFWGGDAQNIHANPTIPTCITTIYPVLNTVKIKKASIYDSDDIILLDDEGKVWQLKDGTCSSIFDDDSTTLGAEIVEKGITIQDIAYRSSDIRVLDSLGRIWNYDYYGNTKCYTLDETCALYNEYNNGNKIVAINSDGGDTLGIDNAGHVWKIDYDASSAICVNDSVEVKYISGDAKVSSFIDKTGNIWMSGDNSYGQLGITGIRSSSEFINICNYTQENPLFNKRFNRVIEDGNTAYFEANDGHKYTFTNNTINDEGQSPKYLENQGIEIQKEINAGNMVLDTEGKVWGLVDKEYVCLTDIEGSELYNAYYNDNLRIVDVQYVLDTLRVGNYYISIDSNKQMWAMGDTGSALKIVAGEKMTKITSSDNMQIEEIYSMDHDNVIVKDINGYYWISGLNQNGIIGIGKSDYGVYEFNKIDIAISEILYYDRERIYVKDTDGFVWAWGKNDKKQVSATQSSSYITSPEKWSMQVKDIKISKYKEYPQVVVLDTDGNVWRGGYIYPGSGYNNLTKVDGLTNIDSICLSKGSVFAVSKTGELWAWGKNAFGNLGYDSGYYTFGSGYRFSDVANPVCLTTTEGNKFYNKQIKQVIDICTSESNASYGYGKVLIQDINNNIYAVGNDSYSISNGYLTSSTYPQPISCGNHVIKDIYRSESNNYIDILIKYSDDKIYCYSNGYSTPLLLDLSEIWDMCGLTKDTSLKDINQILNQGTILYNNILYCYRRPYSQTSVNKVGFYSRIDLNYIKNIKQVYGKYVIDTEGKLYSVTNGIVTDLTAEYKGNNTSGWQIIKSKY